MRGTLCKTLGLAMVLYFAISTTIASGQTTSASSVVPNLISYNGVLKDQSGRTITAITGVTFLLYKDQEGGAPLWLETQNITPDKTGHFTVQLGATNAHGLPPDLFQTGEARWLGVQIGSAPEQTRVLMVAVPYAMKAADAETLGGLPVSAFLLATPGAPANNTAANTPQTQVLNTNATPPPASNVTTSGGTVNTIPLFSTATNIQNSILTQTGTTAVSVGGKLNLPATGTATATGGFKSRPETFVSSSYNSSTASAVPQTFQWQAEPTGNNTSNPSGTMNLLFGSGTSNPTETGLRIGNNGQITFATGQKFPGTGTISGVTAGADLTGGGISGTVTLNLDTTKVPLLNAANVFTGNQTVTGTLTVSSNETVHGNLTGQQLISTVPAGTAPLSVTSNTQVTNLNASFLGGVSAGGFAQVGAYNGFTSGQSIDSPLYDGLDVYAEAPGYVAVFGDAVATTGNGIGVFGYGGSATGYGVYGLSTYGPGVTGASNGIGVYGSGFPAGYFSGPIQTTGKITMYNNAFTYGNGVPSIVSYQSFYSYGNGNNNYTTLVSPTSDAIYRITVFMECSATSSGSTWFTMPLKWTIPTGQPGTDEVTGGGCGSSSQQYTSGSVIAHVKAGAPLQYNYSGMDAPFQVTILVEQLL